MFRPMLSIRPTSIRIACIFTDYFYKSVTLARLSVSTLRMVQMDRNM